MFLFLRFIQLENWTMEQTYMYIQLQAFFRYIPVNLVLLLRLQRACGMSQNQPAIFEQRKKLKREREWKRAEERVNISA